MSSGGETIKIKVIDIKSCITLQLTTFSFETIYPRKNMFEFLTFEIRIFQITSDGEMIKMKVADLEKLYNFVVDNF